MSTEVENPAEAGELVKGGKYLTFFLGNEEYGVEILKVREIIGMLPITRVPRTAECVRGVINLRGKVIPVVDLRTRFGLPRVEETPETVIVVVQAAGTEFGVVVDRVSEVADVPESAVENTPDFGSSVHTEFLKGLAKDEEGNVKLLLDIDQALDTADLASIGDARAEATSW